jgi:hypothetical protein
MSPSELLKYTEDRLLELEVTLKAEDGGPVYQKIKSDPNLTEEEKQKVCCGIARGITEMECTKALNSTNPNTLMRGNSPGTNFMKAYMNEHGKAYFDSVAQKSMLVGDQGVLDGSKAILNNYTTELPLLSEKAIQFLKSSIDVVKDKMPDHQDKAIPLLMANNLILRGSAPEIARLTQVQKKEAKEQNRLEDIPEIDNVFKANNNVQEIANKLSSDNPQFKNGESTALFLDKVAMQKFSETLQKIGDGDLPQHVELVGLPKPDVSSVQVKAANLEDSKKLATLKPEQEKIAKLEAELDRLKNDPTGLDKFKAFFQGGMEKVQQKMVDKIDAAKLDLMQKADGIAFDKQTKQLEETTRQ